MRGLRIAPGERLAIAGDKLPVVAIDADAVDGDTKTEDHADAAEASMIQNTRLWSVCRNVSQTSQ